MNWWTMRIKTAPIDKIEPSIHKQLMKLHFKDGMMLVGEKYNKKIIFRWSKNDNIIKRLTNIYKHIKLE